MELKLVKSSELKDHGKLVKGIDGNKILYLQEGVHTTKFPILDSGTKVTIKE
tara:strand:+ start:3850 stop:4005 length:156 start_codon:yes stop_codon:yes gene_type:complete